MVFIAALLLFICFIACRNEICLIEAHEEDESSHQSLAQYRRSLFKVLEFLSGDFLSANKESESSEAVAKPKAKELIKEPKPSKPKIEIVDVIPKATSSSASSSSSSSSSTSSSISISSPKVVIPKATSAVLPVKVENKVYEDKVFIGGEYKPKKRGIQPQQNTEEEGKKKPKQISEEEGKKKPKLLKASNATKTLQFLDKPERQFLKKSAKILQAEADAKAEAEIPKIPKLPPVPMRQRNLWSLSDILFGSATTTTSATTSATTTGATTLGINETNGRDGTSVEESMHDGTFVSGKPYSLANRANRIRQHGSIPQGVKSQKDLFELQNKRRKEAREKAGPMGVESDASQDASQEGAEDIFEKGKKSKPHHPLVNPLAQRKRNYLRGAMKEKKDGANTDSLALVKE